MAVQVDTVPRPGVCMIAVGTVLFGLSTVRLATGWAPGGDAGPQGSLLCEICNCAAGAALVMWGWSRLRLAKETQPGQSWPAFLRTDVIILGVVALSVSGFAAMTREQRDGLWRCLMDLVELLSLVRGWP